MSAHRARRAPRLAVAVLACVLAVVGLLPGNATAAPGQQVFAFGTAGFFGDLAFNQLNSPIVDFAATASGNGYWELAEDGGIFTFGDAQFFGSAGNLRLNQPLVAMSGTNTGHGYYLLARDGGVFTFGDAQFSGMSGGGIADHVDITVDPVRSGYWLLRADGAVISFGSTGIGIQPAPAGLPAGVQAVAVQATPTGNGLWVVYSNGRVDQFGDAADFGDGPAGVSVVDATAAPDGTGLWLVSSAGRVDALGGVTRTEDATAANPVVAVVAHSANGYWVATRGNGPGSISGRVLDDRGMPVAGVCVDLATFGPRSAITDAEGRFVITNVQPGSYRVRFGGCGSNQSIALEYYKDAYSLSTATPVSVTNSDVTALGDVVVDRGAEITGVVRGPEAQPLGSVCVQGAGPDGLVTPTLTSTTGFYRLGRLRPTSYTVSFTDCFNDEYVGEYYDDAAIASLATPVAVTPGQSRDGIDAQLARAGSISGTVATADGGPLTGPTCVRALSETGVLKQAQVVTGAYRIKGLSTGSYKVHFNECANFPPNAYADEWWVDQPTSGTATPVDVTTGSDTPGVNAVLHRAAEIHGVVTKTDGSPMPFHCVDAVQGDTSVRRTTTSTTGFYRLQGLMAGTYNVRFGSCATGANDATEWWPNAPSKSSSTPITVGSGQTRTGIDARLDPAGFLEGSVTDGSGQPVLACVDVFDEAVQVTRVLARLNGVTGNYRVGGLNSNSYAFRFSDCGGQPAAFATEWFQDAPTRGASAPVGAAAGQTLSVPTAVLDAESVISGTVTGPSGEPISGVCVRPFLPDGTDATVAQPKVLTTVTGYYRASRLAASSYKVRFDVSCRGADYLSEWWNDAGSAATATSVTTQTGATSAGIDAVLARRSGAASSGAPAAPSSVSATAGESSATVTWSGVAGTNGPITGYRITTNPSGATTEVGPDARSSTVTGLTPGQTVTFTVQARNAVGTGPGTTSNPVTPTAPPPPPGGGGGGGDGGGAQPPVTSPTVPSTPDPVSLVLGQTSPTPLPLGAEVVVSGSGFKAFEPGEIVLNSTPRKLGTFFTDASGSFQVVVTVPADADPGTHTLVAVAKGVDGVLRSLSSPVVVVPSALSTGYRLVAADGGIFTFGDAPFAGSAGGATLAKPFAAGASTPSGKGYWLAGSDGLVLTFGDADFFGSLAGTKLNQPIVGMAATPTGKGYWLVATDGGIFAFGDAAFQGSTGDLRLNKPIVGMTTTPTGNGYWLVASDGGIFAFGDAAFFGSTGAMKLNQPIVGMAASPTGQGYWLVASDGGIFTFGDAAFHGSTGDIRLNQPIVAMAPTPSGRGYRLVASDGGIFTFGDATFLGSTGDLKLVKPILAIV